MLRRLFLCLPVGLAKRLIPAPHLVTVLGLSVPIVGGIIACVTIGLTSSIFNHRGPRRKELASQVTDDEVERLLQQNMQGYLDGPSVWGASGA
jgi:hypothetical protein